MDLYIKKWIAANFDYYNYNSTWYERCEKCDDAADCYDTVELTKNDVWPYRELCENCLYEYIESKMPGKYHDRMSELEDELQTKVDEICSEFTKRWKIK